MYQRLVGRFYGEVCSLWTFGKLCRWSILGWRQLFGVRFLPCLNTYFPRLILSILPVVRLLVRPARDPAQVTVSNAQVPGRSPSSYLGTQRLMRQSRANLLGTCVPYDAASGICDTSDAHIDGSYVLDPAKGRCDCEFSETWLERKALTPMLPACPQGCFSCGIPGFSVTSKRQDLRCTACQEGWVLQDGACVQSCEAGHYLPGGSQSVNGTCQSKCCL
jgi:hypothetical protein